MGREREREESGDWRAVAINSIVRDKLPIKLASAAMHGPTRTYLALSHITPFVTHLFSRVSAEILTYAGHYPVQLARSEKNYCCTCRTVENRHDRTRYLQPGRFSPRKSFDRSVPLPTLLPWSITLLETVRKKKKEQLLRGGFRAKLNRAIWNGFGWVKDPCSRSTLLFNTPVPLF